MSIRRRLNFRIRNRELRSSQISRAAFTFRPGFIVSRPKDQSISICGERETINLSRRESNLPCDLPRASFFYHLHRCPLVASGGDEDFVFLKAECCPNLAS